MSETEKSSEIVPPVPAPASVVARIAKIALSDYRAFPAGHKYEFNLGPEGKNLLLFGENGSGKTSLFRALRDLAALKPGPVNFADSRHVFTPGEEGFISIQLTAGTPGEFRWDHGDEHPRGTGGKPYADLAGRCRFLDYRALLETNFVHRTQVPNLFDLLVKDVLADLPVIVDGKQERLGLLHERMMHAKPINHWPRHLKPADKACEDLTAALVNHLPEVVKEGKRLIAKMGFSDLSFDLKPGTVKYDQMTRKFVGQEVGLSVSLFSKPIDHPQLFLNEARLTALALAIYLGAARLVLQSPSPGNDGRIIVRLLVLDDVLIGLDLANRLPVLKVLNDEFADWQIILMTYDRIWYELAKENTEHTGNWIYINLRQIEASSSQPGWPYIINANSDLVQEYITRAEKHYQDDDRMAAAVYLRAALETRVKNACRDHGVKVAYKPDPKEVKLDHLWQAIVERQKERQANGKTDFIALALMQDVETVRSTILNRLSHSGTPEFLKDEVKFALDTVKKLHQHHFTKI